MNIFVENIRKYPFARLLIPLLLGIVWQHYLPFAFNLNIVVIGLLTALILLNFSKVVNNYNLRWLWGIALFMLLFALGGMRIQNTNTISKLPQQQSLIFSGIVIENPQMRENSTKIAVSVNEYRDTSTVWKTSNEVINLYIKPDSTTETPIAGNKLLFKTSLTPISEPTNPYEFNYKEYKARRGLYSIAFITSSQFEIIGNNQLPFYKQIPLQIQQFVNNCFKDASLTGNELAVANALTIGDKQYLDDDLKQSYASAGVIHLLAVSGLHVGIVFWALSFVLSFLFKKRYSKIIRCTIIIIMLWIYAAVVGFSPSVTRAVTMFSFLVIGQALNRPYYSYNAIAASAFLLCIYNPYCIFEVGFQLSYTAVLGIFYFQPKLNKLIYIKQWLPRKIWSVICVTLAAQLTTMPIVLYSFHQFPTYFLPANLVLIVVTTVIIYVAILLITLAWIPAITSILGFMLGNGLWLLNKSVTWIEALPYSIVEGVYISRLQCVLLLVAIMLIAFWVVKRSPQLLMGILSIFIIIFGIRLFHVIDINAQQTITVYSTPKSSFISFIDGTKGFCLRDSLNIENYFDYNTKNHLISQGFSSARELANYTFTNSLPNSYHGYMEFGGKTIVVLTNQHYSNKFNDETLLLDYLLVSSATTQNPNDALTCLNPQTIIIDSSTPTWKAKQWVNLSNEKNIACHWVQNHGAFVYNGELRYIL